MRFIGRGERIRTSDPFPAFVFDYLKESSGTGFMRSGLAPNLRVQDGFKQRLLYNEHENVLSCSEGAVAQNLFRPYHADTSVVVSYDACRSPADSD